MKKFEYDVRSYPMDKKTSLVAMQDDLNLRGRDGWELVSVSTSEFSNLGHTAFLKRQISASSHEERV